MLTGNFDCAFATAAATLDKLHALGEDGKDTVILRSIIGLGHSLGLKVVAEGVETAKMWRALARLKYPTVQGFFVSRPLEPTDLLTWVQRSGWTSLAPAAT